jgi:hypothetical protein
MDAEERDRVVFCGLIVVAQSVPFDDQRGSRALSFFTFEKAIFYI